MSNYIILALCIIVLLSYIFDITSKYSKIPGVFFLIILGIVLQMIIESTGYSMPNIKPALPIVGTLGLIMIVMEAALDIELRKNKKSLIIKSISSAIFLSAIFVFITTFVFIRFMGFSLQQSVLNSIPLSIISSSVAIASSNNLQQGDREFVVYESSFSDITGIMIFDLFLLGKGSFGQNIFSFFVDGFLMIIIALISTAGLAILLHRTRYHVNYVIILTSVILFYSLAEIFNLPALLLILIFGLILSNNQFLEYDIIKYYVDFGKFKNDINSFKKILGELTFIVKSFFFIIFGFYTSIEGLFLIRNLLTGLIITIIIFLLRSIFFRFVLKLPAVPLVFFAPRGLITILLFLSIPIDLRLPMITEEVVTIVIFLSMFFLMAGNLLYSRTKISSEKNIVKNEQE